MMNKKYDILLFDLDGTLMDSGEGIMRCAQYALEKMNICVEDYRDLRCFVGPPLEDSFKDFYGFTHEQAMDAVEAYRERYFKLGIREQKPYEGVYEVLKQLRDEGFTLCLATSKMNRQAEWVVENYNFKELIYKVFARDDKGLRHTKADVINHGLAELNVTDRSRVLMIGDRKFDIAGAKECHIDSMGVLWGYGDKEEHEQAGANYICKDWQEMLSIIK